MKLFNEAAGEGSTGITKLTWLMLRYATLFFRNSRFNGKRSRVTEASLVMLRYFFATPGLTENVPG